MKWWGPKGVTCPHAEVDLRPGGAYRIGNRHPDGSTTWISGVFELVRPPDELAYSWNIGLPGADGSRVHVEFLDHPDGTELVVRHERLSDAVRGYARRRLVRLPGRSSGDVRLVASPKGRAPIRRNVSRPIRRTKLRAPISAARVASFLSPLHRHPWRVRSASEADNRRRPLNPEEIRKLDAYFKRVFQNPRIEIKARPRKEDSAEVYVGDEFIGLVYKDEEDGDYNFSMAILDIDLA